MSVEQNGGAGLAERVRLNQKVLRAALQPQYDFIVCGSGSSGSGMAVLTLADGSRCDGGKL